MDTRIIRLSDLKTVWLSSSNVHLEIDEVPFEISSNHSKFVCISLDQKKAVIFPFQVFSVLGEDYYFGPAPAKFQIVQSTAINWLIAASLQSKDSKDGGPASLAPAAPSLGARAPLLEFFGICLWLVCFIFQWSKGVNQKCRSAAFELLKQTAQVAIMLLTLVPVLAQAPEIAASRVQEMTDTGESIALAQSLPKVAQSRSKLDLRVGFEKETEGDSRADVENVADIGAKPKIVEPHFEEKNRESPSPAQTLNLCTNLPALSALISDIEIIQIQEDCQREKR